MVTILFLPAFFALTGLRTEIGLVVVVAGLGHLPADHRAGDGREVRRHVRGRRGWSGCRWRFAARLGILMNTRGLMELVVLNVGLDLGVISPTLFTMMVIMALVTTAMTAPLLRR